MPVHKFASIADMPQTPPARAETLATRIRVLWRRSFVLSKPSPPRGVARFSSIEAANDARFRRTLERMKRTSGQASNHGSK